MRNVIFLIHWNGSVVHLDVHSICYVEETPITLNENVLNLWNLKTWFIYLPYEINNLSTFLLQLLFNNIFMNEFCGFYGCWLYRYSLLIQELNLFQIKNLWTTFWLLCVPSHSCIGYHSKPQTTVNNLTEITTYNMIKFYKAQF